MDRDSIEPLGPRAWFASVRRLSALAAAGPATIGSALRHAYHLAQLTPHGLRTSVAAALNERAFEDLLEAEVYDVAAQALVGSSDGLALVRQPGSKAIFAEVRFADGRGMGCGQGRTIAAAILHAWCTAALALDTSAGGADGHAKVVPFRARTRDEPAPLGV